MIRASPLSGAKEKCFHILRNFCFVAVGNRYPNHFAMAHIPRQILMEPRRQLLTLTKKKQIASKDQRRCLRMPKLSAHLRVFAIRKDKCGILYKKAMIRALRNWLSTRPAIARADGWSLRTA